MTETEITPIDKDQRSISILQSLQNSAWFSQDQEDPTQICLYRKTGDNLKNITPSGVHFPIADFFDAVDYYIQHHEAESLVSIAMQKPGGYVNVWSGSGEKARVVVKIDNHRVPQILEFAYQLARSG